MRSTMNTQLNFIEVSVPQYAKDQGVSEATIRRRCEQGLLNAYKINDDLSGSHWKIRVPRGDVVSRDEYDRLMREKIELEAKLEIARKALA